MSKGIQHIAANTQNVSQKAIEASTAATEGTAVVESALNLMRQIHTSVEQLTQPVAKLGDSSEQIGHIAKVITDISTQTNLLSLNASIEAARAGEHGQGFAVVALEVRKLAEQLERSAKEITRLIEGIQQDTVVAVDGTKLTTSTVQKGLVAVESAGSSFKLIHDSVTSVAEDIQEVSAAIEEMSASSDKVSHAMHAIAQVAVTTATGTQNISTSTEEQLATLEEVTASVTELAKMAKELHGVIGKFTI